MTTKKLLAPFDPDKHQQVRNGILIPDYFNQENHFYELSKHSKWKFGAVVFIGVRIDTEEFLSKIEENPFPYSQKISTTLLETYFSAVNEFKIGEIVEVIWEEDQLQLVKKKFPRPQSRRLP